MFRIPLLVAISLTIAFGGGIGLTRYVISHSSGFGAITIGAWEAFPKAQTDQADPYAKSHRAKSGRLLLGSAEGLTFYAANDDNGASLNAACTYTVSGDIPPARFWTLSATDLENRPISARPGLPSALNSHDVLYHADGSLTFTVSSKPAPGNWLAITPGRRFHLALTLFDTPAAGNSGLIDLTVPTITKGACGNA
jgi:hypothetical protein